MSPIIKRNLKLDPNKGLAKGLLDKGIKTTVDIGFIEEMLRWIKSTEPDSIDLEEVLPQTDGSGAAVGGAAMSDLARPKGKSFLEDLLTQTKNSKRRS